MSKLRPCPFCGGKAEVHPSDDWHASLTGKTFFVWCGNCETRGDYYDTEAEAIAAWNTRAEHTDKLLRCLENDYGIKASWDGLRKVWLTERTVPWDETCEHGLPMTEENMREHGWVREHTCKIVHVKNGAMYDVWRCSACGYEYAGKVSEDGIVQNYCPNCGAKVVG